MPSILKTFLRVLNDEKHVFKITHHFQIGLENFKNNHQKTQGKILFVKKKYFKAIADF